MNRSSEPISVRWTTIGVCSALSRADVGEPEPGRHLEVELDGAALPAAAERVLEVQVDLRPVERAVAGVERVRRSRGDSSARAQRRLGLVPLLVGAEPVLGPGRELGPDVQSEEVVDEEAEVEAAEDLVLDLLRACRRCGRRPG